MPQWLNERERSRFGISKSPELNGEIRQRIAAIIELSSANEWRGCSVGYLKPEGEDHEVRRRAFAEP